MKINKILVIISLILILLVFASSTIFATDYTKPNSFTGTTTNLTGVQKIGNRVIGALRVIGSAVSVVIILVIGIKYITGSAQEKAEYKKTMIPYLVGAVLIFAASTIAGWVYDWASAIK